MKKLLQAAVLIKEWALATRHRVMGERMLMEIHSELYDANLDEQAAVIVEDLEALRHAPYETTPQPATITKAGIPLAED